MSEVEHADWGQVFDAELCIWTRWDLVVFWTGANMLDDAPASLALMATKSEVPSPKEVFYPISSTYKGRVGKYARLEYHKQSTFSTVVPGRPYYPRMVLKTLASQDITNSKGPQSRRISRDYVFLIVGCSGKYDRRQEQDSRFQGFYQRLIYMCLVQSFGSQYWYDEPIAKFRVEDSLKSMELV
ncbi:hypothetical protein Tco_0198831 [Tanacetum coccineum]